MGRVDLRITSFTSESGILLHNRVASDLFERKGLGFLILTVAGLVASGPSYGLPEQRLSRY